MPTFDYDDMAETAAELIEEFGFETQLQFPAGITGPKHNPTKGEPVDLDVVVCRVKLRQNEADGQRIVLTDSKLLLSPAGVTVDPTTAASLKLKGAWRKVVAVEPVNPGDVDVFWKLYVR